MVFVLALPVAKIESLCSIAESLEIVGAASVDHAVFDMGCEPLIIFGVKSTVVKTGEYRIFVDSTLYLVM